MVEEIRDPLGKLLAIIISPHAMQPGIRFFTPDDFSQQLADISHPKGKIIEPHVHNAVIREVRHTQEILFIRKGRLRVDFYDESQGYLVSRVVDAEGILVLVTGGHGFEVLEDVDMIEVKQGPYAGEQDKTRFCGVSPDQICWSVAE